MHFIRIVKLDQRILVHPRMSDSNVILQHNSSVILLIIILPSSYRIRWFRSEIVRDVRIARHHNSASTEPRAEGNFDVLSAPDVQRRVHLTLLPPILGNREHAHRNGRVVIGTGAATPELTKRVVDSSRARSLRRSRLWNLPIPAVAGFTLKSSVMMKSTKLTIVLLFCTYHFLHTCLPPSADGEGFPATSDSLGNEHLRIQ